MRPEIIKMLLANSVPNPYKAYHVQKYQLVILLTERTIQSPQIYSELLSFGVTNSVPNPYKAYYVQKYQLVI
jgi:hypothetical protein